MNICLNSSAKQGQAQRVVVALQDHLPSQIIAPCELVCDFAVERVDDYYLLSLNVNGSLAVSCQRCLGEFHEDYSRQMTLAVCSDEAIAERLMVDFESIVSIDDQVNLIELLKDELHLSAPEKHQQVADCDNEMSQFIRSGYEIVNTTLGLEAKTR